MQKKVFSKEDYINIHESVMKFKETREEKYITQVMDAFAPFTQRYVNLICYGRYKVDDPTIMKFISLYAGSKKAVSSIRQGKNVKSSAEFSLNTVEMIKETCSTLTQEDIEHDIYVTFLHMINNYKDTKPSFHTYVLRTFHFNLYRQLDKHMRNPLSKTSLIHTDAQYNNSDEIFDRIEDISSEKELSYIDEKVSVQQLTKIQDTIKKNNTNIYDDDFFDINWINGYTCSSIFDCLTPMERRILYLWNIEKKTDGQIAEMFGLYRGTINSKRLKAKRKLEEHLKEKHIIKSIDN